MKKLKPAEKKKSKLLKRVPLKTHLFVSLQMQDIENWKNGEYLGDNEKLIKMVEGILDDVFEWIDNGMPGGKDKDLTRYKNCKSSPIIDVSSSVR